MVYFTEGVQNEMSTCSAGAVICIVSFLQQKSEDIYSDWHQVTKQPHTYLPILTMMWNNVVCIYKSYIIFQLNEKATV